MATWGASYQPDRWRRSSKNRPYSSMASSHWHQQCIFNRLDFFFVEHVISKIGFIQITVGRPRTKPIPLGPYLTRWNTWFQSGLSGVELRGAFLPALGRSGLQPPCVATLFIKTKNKPLLWAESYYQKQTIEPH